ncbi:hypothetical protein BDZ45DRAFT_703189 [Acephala macrosclerotiorum]|nr:hypothetical protein BDZ45DRAFT_703189 [Acephala macrosclerotiorum]
MLRINPSIFTGGLLVTTPPAAADCTRSSLLEASEHYITAQSTGALQPLLTTNFSYIENNKTKDFKSGALALPLTIAHNHTLLDAPPAQHTPSSSSPIRRKQYLIETQIHYTPSTDGSLKISLMDAIVSTTGDWQFNATKSLSYIESKNWGPLNALQQISRTALLAAADGYLDLWSAYTGKGTAADSCNVGIATGTVAPNTARRYVVDESMGCVSVLCTFQCMRNAPDSHEFRLADGKPRYVHTMTVMRRTT